MARRVAAAAVDAGADEVVAVGGSLPPGFWSGRTVEDRHPGEGPLGGVVTALGVVPTDVVLVVACDLLNPSPKAMAATVDALVERPDGDVALPTRDGIPQWHHAAWRRRSLVPLAAVFDAGERSLHGAVSATGLVVVRLADVDATALVDADTPSDLRGL
jgi:molybdopterin-guanine dinucleotide biosynthesis protein A